jgi:8-oxo-dGTP pyrophosphatase MutT (NUDIX family)
MNAAQLPALTAWLKERLNQPLPGSRAHEEMKAVPVGEKFTINHSGNPKSGGVLILLYPNKGEVYLPLILRSSYNGAHSGQISFPGGKSELNESPESTALREAREEIGVNPEAVKLIGKLSPHYVIPSNILVQPVIGVSESKPDFLPDAREVVTVIEFKISSILSPDSIRNGIIKAGNYTLNAPFFNSEAGNVWGATAMMLNEFRFLLNEWK